MRGDSEYRKLLLEGEGVGGHIQQLLVVWRNFHWKHCCPQKKRNSDSSPFCVSHLGLTIWRSYFISSSVCLFFCNADVIDEWLFLFGDPYMIDRTQLVVILTCWKRKSDYILIVKVSQTRKSDSILTWQVAKTLEATFAKALSKSIEQKNNTTSWWRRRWASLKGSKYDLD